jgi:hypothetical protein
MHRKREYVKDATHGDWIITPVAWSVEWAVEDSGLELHCVIGFFASKEEAEARAARVLRGDPDVKGYEPCYLKEGVRSVKPYELRGNQRVRPKEVWACLLSAQGLSEVVHAVFDSKVRVLHTCSGPLPPPL